MATVLLAEDDADIRLLVTLTLKRAGYQVRAFEDGLSALADARKNPLDLAILDSMMPGMTGVEVCRELRRDPATAKIPVILLTALARESDITAGLAAGADDYIVKPFSPREFTARVGAVLDRVQAGTSPRGDSAQPSLAVPTAGSAAAPTAAGRLRSAVIPAQSSNTSVTAATDGPSSPGQLS
jgi:DNA-binding response OmpR family regulator